MFVRENSLHQCSCEPKLLPFFDAKHGPICGLQVLLLSDDLNISIHHIHIQQSTGIRQLCSTIQKQAFSTINLQHSVLKTWVPFKHGWPLFAIEQPLANGYDNQNIWLLKITQTYIPHIAFAFRAV